MLFGTDETGFQNNLNAFYEYSDMWRLDINYDKTKILIFGTYKIKFKKKYLRMWYAMILNDSLRIKYEYKIPSFSIEKYLLPV